MSVSPPELEATLARAEALPDRESREVARELVRSVLGLHREGLARLVEWLANAGDTGKALLRRAGDDELIASLLAIHDLQVTTPAGFVPVERLHRARQAPGCERCELCGHPVSEAHPHLLELAPRRLLCSCEACGLLFDGGVDRRYRRVRSIAAPLTPFSISDEGWRALAVPVGLAFFVRVSTSGRVIAGYPGPGGALEATVDPDAWTSLVAANPVLAELTPDVEALLVDRLGATPRHYRVSVDHCYRLTGMLRSASGDDAVPTIIDRFFHELEQGPT
jgi:hypothetical protein